jgi:hypothetical protein
VAEDTFGGCTLYAAHGPRRALPGCWPCDCPLQPRARNGDATLDASAAAAAGGSPSGGGEEAASAAGGSGSAGVDEGGATSGHQGAGGSEEGKDGGEGRGGGASESTPSESHSAADRAAAAAAAASVSARDDVEAQSACDAARSDCGCGCKVPGSGGGGPGVGSAGASTLPRLPRRAAQWHGCALPRSLPDASTASKPCPQLLRPGHGAPPWDDIVLQVLVSLSFALFRPYILLFYYYLFIFRSTSFYYYYVCMPLCSDGGPCCCVTVHFSQEHSYLPTVAAARGAYFYPALAEYLAAAQQQADAETGKRPRIVAFMTHGGRLGGIEFGPLFPFRRSSKD